ncbi:MAG: hypothetical protein FWE93_01025 [Alphaproteobacteria bacterium]|nr:hypothetical protein [Alphaproteobacteria bacterium]
MEKKKDETEQFVQQKQGVAPPPPSIKLDVDQESKTHKIGGFEVIQILYLLLLIGIVPVVLYNIYTQNLESNTTILPQSLGKGACGSANGVTTASLPAAANLCSAGTQSVVTTNATTYTWSCGKANCSAPRHCKGVCRTTSGMPGGHCTCGTTVEEDYYWNIDYTAIRWKCNGSGGGASTHCSCLATRRASGAAYCK